MAPHQHCRAQRPRVFLASLILLALGPAALPSVAAADDQSSRGRAILNAHCGRCHSIDRVGESPLSSAPPLRDVYARFPLRELEEELKEGKVSRHRDMPQIAFSNEEVAAILDHLYRISTTADH